MKPRNSRSEPDPIVRERLEEVENIVYYVTRVLDRPMPDAMTMETLYNCLIPYLQVIKSKK